MESETLSFPPISFPRSNLFLLYHFKAHIYANILECLLAVYFGDSSIRAHTNLQLKNIYLSFSSSTSKLYFK